MSVFSLIIGIFFPILTFYLGFKAGWDSKPQKVEKSRQRNSHRDNLIIYNAGYQDGFKDATNNVDNYGDSPMLRN